MPLLPRSSWRWLVSGVAPLFAVRRCCACACALGALLCWFFFMPPAALAAPVFPLPELAPQGAATPARFPERAFSLTVSATKGSPETLFFAAMQENFSRTVPGRFLVEYAPGRGGAYAVNALLTKPTDGYAAAVAVLPAFLLQTYLNNRLYTLEDAVPVCMLAAMRTALWVDAASPYQTLEDFLVDVRNRPAGSVFMSGIGSYSGHHMVHMLFERSAGVVVAYMPFMGTKDSSQAVRQGVALACWGAALSPETMPGMRPLAVAAEARVGVLPQVPTFQEVGIDLVHRQYMGIVVPAATVATVQEKVAAFFLEQAREPAFAAKAAGIGYELHPVPLADIPAFMAAQQTAINAFLADYTMIAPEDARPSLP